MDKIMKNKKGLGTSYLSLLVWYVESGNWGEKKQKKKQNTEYLKNEKCLLEEIKTIFQNF